ncbi:Ig-like domain-containing protein [Deinococcus budaensis]|uniref:Peptidase C-terminal archaeal/bacterial domain-containing protein n=1 Tax=Deinococcus budaensis TaxID=1665626 RepID=A0A7W8GFD0_9DEIO|nr:Ig-like domain-containing protein [Deinococcus budaensis]MBB5234611.1 hypothetical protein [Deinococcus budaensis]
MKPNRSLFLALLTGVLLSACGSQDTVRPSVTLTAAPETLTAGGVKLVADAQDNVGVTEVRFYRGETLIATDTAAPFEAADTTLTAAQNGTVTYRAVARDGAGNTAEATDTVNVALDAGEPNDSVAAARALPVGTAQTGIIAGQARDMDYFKFEAAAGDMLRLTVKSLSVNPASTLDPYVMILMPDGKTVLEKDDDSGAGLEADIRFNVPQAGTYTVVVTSFTIHDDEKAADDKATNTYQILLARR